MNRVRNYQKELDRITGDILKSSSKDNSNRLSVPTLFLHSCCAPCSSYVLEYLREFFRITVFYYNPNITEDQEYRKRVAEQKRLIGLYNKEAEQAGQNGAVVRKKTQDKYRNSERAHSMAYEIEIIEGDYEPECFYEIARGLEQCPEGGERCFACYALRLREAAKRARSGGYDYFTTTLTISPLKNAAKLNEIGERLSEEYGVAWLPADFKKKNGYQRSIELSREYGLYRQDYCGCVYSRVQREMERKERNGAGPAAE